jgi:hypothetical protein
LGVTYGRHGGHRPSLRDRAECNARGRRISDAPRPSAAPFREAIQEAAPFRRPSVRRRTTRIGRRLSAAVGGPRFGGAPLCGRTSDQHPDSSDLPLILPRRLWGSRASFPTCLPFGGMYAQQVRCQPPGGRNLAALVLAPPPLTAAPCRALSPGVQRQTRILLSASLSSRATVRPGRGLLLASPGVAGQWNVAECQDRAPAVRVSSGP